MIKLFISEEYGFREWYAELNDLEYLQLLNRWETICGLTCLVPVSLIIPQAVELDELRTTNPTTTHRCHIHEYDDSFIDGSDYKIPQDTHFWMDGKKYQQDEYWPIRQIS